MAAVKDTVAALGGKLQIASEPGQGTLFSIELPKPHSRLAS
jgi:chemotaxis protein histidine kinase CheA